MLYPYQLGGADWLLNRDGEPLREHSRYLADGMGLGKTRQAIAAAVEANPRSTLVVAPASVVPNWPVEWDDLGLPRDGVQFLSYTSPKLRQLVESGAEFGAVILDEAHYAKNPTAKRTLAALTLARRADQAMLLSGTPMPNHPGELWAPIRALWPEIPDELGIDSEEGWYDRFCVWRPVRVSRYSKKTRRAVFDSKNLDQLRPLLKRIMLRRTLEDVGLQLPPLRIDLQLLPKDRAFEAHLKQLGATLEVEPPPTVRRYIGTYKARLIADIVAQELADRAYEKIVILGYHQEVLTVFRERLNDFGVAGIDGSTAGPDRRSAIHRFRDDDRVRVFVGQQTAAGTGLNLQVASEIILAEPDWSPDQNRQYIKRVHRIGSERPVRARVFAVAGTQDEVILRANARKTRAQEEVGLR